MTLETRIDIDYLLWWAKKFIDMGEYDLARENVEQAISMLYKDWNEHDALSLEQVNDLKREQIRSRQ